MKRTLLLRLLLSAIAIVSMLPMVLPGFFATLPLQVEIKPGIGYVIQPEHGTALPEGLQSGDVLAIDQMDVKARIATLITGSLIEGSSYTIVAKHGDQLISLPVKVVINDSAEATTSRLSNLPLMLSVLALALITLWRGRDWTAWGLTMFSLGICARLLITTWPVDAMTGLYADFIGRLVMWLIVLPGLYIAVQTLIGEGLSPAVRRGFLILFIAVLSVTMTLSLGKAIALILTGWIGWMPYRYLLSIPGTLLVLMPVLLLFAGYRRSDAARRLRIRWVFWSSALLGVSVVIAVFLPESSTAGQLTITSLQALSFAGYVYAVLRHRLVDVSFIVDRALAYGLTTSLVVGVFAILENFIEQAAVGNDASFLLQAGATLVLALALNRVHHRVEGLVDRLFFRRQRRATHELRRFAQQCAFIEQHERLLTLTAERIEQAIGGSGVAIYERRDGRYLQLIQRGDAAYPAALEVDDLAFVSLRASLQAIDLDDLSGSALGADGCVFPMALRGVLIGAIVCGARRGEQFAPDERTELAKLAQEVGIALYVLRAREHEKFVVAVATGEMRDPQQTARQLLPTLATYRSDFGADLNLN